MRRVDADLLTDLEANILQLLAKGHSRVWIEAQLGISRATLYRHLEVIRHKLQAQNNTHAVAIALEQDLIKPDDDPSPALLASPATDTPVPPWRCLTRREWEIFLLLGEVETSQASDRQLARQLEIAEGTLKKHLQRIYHKLGVANRSSAALLAAQAKQVRPEGETILKEASFVTGKVTHAQ
jgi:DNA-binding CsgD family transcriptional regulator